MQNDGWFLGYTDLYSMCYLMQLCDLDAGFTAGLRLCPDESETTFQHLLTLIIKTILH